MDHRNLAARRIRRGGAVAWQRYCAWVTTTNVTDAELTEEVTRDLIDRASTAPPDPHHPVDLTPTAPQIEKARARKQWARATGSAVAALMTASIFVQAIVIAPLLAVAMVIGVAAWLWHLGS